MKKILGVLSLIFIYNACVPKDKCDCDISNNERTIQFVDKIKGSKNENKGIAVFKFTTGIKTCYGTCTAGDSSTCVVLYSIQNSTVETIDLDSLTINGALLGKVTVGGSSTTNEVNLSKLLNCGAIRSDSIRIAVKNITYR